LKQTGRQIGRPDSFNLSWGFYNFNYSLKKESARQPANFEPASNPHPGATTLAPGAGERPICSEVR